MLSGRNILLKINTKIIDTPCSTNGCAGASRSVEDSIGLDLEGEARTEDRGRT